MPWSKKNIPISCHMGELQHQSALKVFSPLQLWRVLFRYTGTDIAAENGEEKLGETRLVIFWIDGRVDSYSRNLEKSKPDFIFRFSRKRFLRR